MNYKEKYEMALEGIQEILSSGEDSIKMSRLQLRLQGIFPELKESEDDRIRKALINGFKDYRGWDEEWFDGITVREAISWLEKQGEHANFRNKIQIGDRVTRNEDGVLVNLSQLNRVAKKDENQGEKTKPIEDFDTEFEKQVSCLIASAMNRDYEYTKDFVKWTSEGLLNYAKHEIEKQGNMGISEATKKKLEDNLNRALEKETPESWNKFLDEQGEQNSTNEIGNYDHKKVLQTIINEQNSSWSEEDEETLNTIINHFKVDIECTDEDDIVRWLKNLKDRYTWKPSDEQMGVIEAVINNRSFQRRHLDSLYEQLKKLRGE